MITKNLYILILLILLNGCNKSNIQYENGTYYGEGEGHHGPIKVKVTVEQEHIKIIEVIEDYEIPGLREIVYEQLPKRIIKKNNWEVDEISGATLTSDGLKEAVADALSDVKSIVD